MNTYGATGGLCNFLTRYRQIKKYRVQKISRVVSAAAGYMKINYALHAHLSKEKNDYARKS